MVRADTTAFLVLGYLLVCHGYLSANRAVILNHQRGLSGLQTGAKVCTKRGHLFAPLHSAAHMAVALDKSAIPRGFFAAGRNGNLAIIVFVVIASVFTKVNPIKLLRSLADGREYDDDKDDYDYENSEEYDPPLLKWNPPLWISTLGDRALDCLDIAKRPVIGLFAFVKLALRVITAKIALTGDVILETASDFFGFNLGTEIDIRDWKVCVMEEREIIDADIIKYRFQLANDNAVIPLGVGQELLMCSVDNNDKVLKESFFPVSSPDAKGYFEVLVRRGESKQSRFSRALETMALGDELAFKGGRSKLNYQGNDDPITSISIAASGLGIPAALQILRGVLSDRESSIDDTEVLWLNEDNADFVCEKEVESLELRYIEKLLVTRILEEDIYGRDLTKNQDIFESVSPYDEGRLAIISAPDWMVSSLRDLYKDQGYPIENILSIPCNENHH